MTTERFTKIAAIVFFLALTALVGLGVSLGLNLVSDTNKLLKNQADDQAQTRTRTREALKEVERIIREEVKEAIDAHTLEAHQAFVNLEKNIGELLNRPAVPEKVVERQVVVQAPAPQRTTATTRPRVQAATATTQPATTTTTCPKLPNGKCRPQ